MIIGLALPVFSLLSSTLLFLDLRSNVRKALGAPFVWIKGYFSSVSNLAVLLPYLWSSNRHLWTQATKYFLCLVAIRVLNFSLPHQWGSITEEVVTLEGKSLWPDGCRVMFRFTLYLVLQYVSAWLPELKSRLWLSVSSLWEIATKKAVAVNITHQCGAFYDSHNKIEIEDAFSATQYLRSTVESVYIDSVLGALDLLLLVANLFFRYGLFQSAMVSVCLAASVAVQITRVLENKKYNDAVKEEIRCISRMIRGWRSIANFNTADYETARFSGIMESRRMAHMKSQKGQSWTGTRKSLIFQITQAASILNILRQILAGHAAPGDFVVACAQWASCHTHILRISNLVVQIPSTAKLISPVSKTLQIPLCIESTAAAQPLRLRGGRVEFKNVSFRYGKKAVLEDVTLSIMPGTTVGIIGESGAGKSTVLQLLQRIYDVTTGQILIDGQDIRDVTVDSLRGRGLVISHSTPLLNNTIKNNVKYGQPNTPDEDIYQACKAACIHDAILDLPKKYETMFNSNAPKLSITG